MSARRRRGQLVDAREPNGIAADDPIWSRLRDIVSLLNAAPIVGGRLISEDDRTALGSGVALTSGVVRAIPHKLGRPALGFFEVATTFLHGSGGCGLVSAPFPPGTSAEDYIAVLPTNTGRTCIWVF